MEANFFCALEVSVSTGRCTLCPDRISSALCPVVVVTVFVVVVTDG